MSLGNQVTVSVEGNIGAGKSTLCNYIASRYPNDITVLCEPIDKWQNCSGHNILDLFYKDPCKYSFLFQSYVQLTLLRQLVEEVPTKIKLCERSLFSAKYCFVQNLREEEKLAEPEYAVLDAWFQYIVNNNTVQPHAIIYLRTNPAVAHDRLVNRNRAEEATVSLEYLQKLHVQHESWLVHQQYGATPPVCIINGDENLDNIKKTYNEVAEKIVGGTLW